MTAWVTQLNDLAERAGFRAAKLKDVQGAPVLPGNARLWTSAYAQILALTGDDAAAETLLGLASLGQLWLDASCIDLERRSRRVIDAYLVVVVPRAPEADVFNVVRDIELNPVACRKHIVWPIEATSPDESSLEWGRILRVTSIALPLSPRSAGMTNTPELATEAQKTLLRDIQELQGRNAARRHAGENP